MTRTLRGAAVVAGIGETTYYKRGGAPHPEFRLVLEAITAACADAGIDPKRIDGFCGYSNDRSEPARLAAALGIDELRLATMQWGGGGGGGAGAVASAAAAIATGMADCVVVHRGLAQGQFGRFGQGWSNSGVDRQRMRTVTGIAAHTMPYGVMSPGQVCAMRTTRLFAEHPGTSAAAQKAIALAAYHHAQRNPRAIMYGRPLTPEAYDEARWIVEPWRLFDFCQENDGAAALVLVPADRAAEGPNPPAYVLAAQTGAPYRAGASLHNQPDYTSSSFTTLAPRLYATAGLGPGDIDVVQAYENFSGAVVASLVEHGLCTYENADEVLTFDNLVAPGGGLPLNTSGGNLAECYMHGLGQHIEAVRQLRGTSTAQVPGAEVGLVIAGPMTAPVSSAIYGTAATI